MSRAAAVAGVVRGKSPLALVDVRRGTAVGWMDHAEVWIHLGRGVPQNGGAARSRGDEDGAPDSRPGRREGHAGEVECERKGDAPLGRRNEGSPWRREASGRGDAPLGSAAGRSILWRLGSEPRVTSDWLWLEEGSATGCSSPRGSVAARLECAARKDRPSARGRRTMLPAWIVAWEAAPLPNRVRRAGSRLRSSPLRRGRLRNRVRTRWRPFPINSSEEGALAPESEQNGGPCRATPKREQTPSGSGARQGPSQRNSGARSVTMRSPSLTPP
jgi:hypothetical protein